MILFIFSFIFSIFALYGALSLATLAALHNLLRAETTKSTAFILISITILSIMLGTTVAYVFLEVIQSQVAMTNEWINTFRNKTDYTFSILDK